MNDLSTLQESPLQAPFPWFGGKRRVAKEVWQAFGEVINYVEPFFGSGAVLLNAPWPSKRTETVNDKDGFVCNFWRSISYDPESVAHYADWPVNHIDLTARHLWLVQNKHNLVQRLELDHEYFDPKIAGYWVWGLSSWIGRGFCDGTSTDESVCKSRPHLTSPQGINAKELFAKRVINSTRIDTNICNYFTKLYKRIRNVRVCCGDWSSICGPSPTTHIGLTGVFLDPPYSEKAERTTNIYTEDSLTVAHDVRKWCIENSDNKLLRIALCGYEKEHDELEELGWRVHAWKSHGGYGRGRGGKGEDNRHRERIWFSPNCLDPTWMLPL